MGILRRLFLFLTPYWKTLSVSAGLLLARAGIELIPPLFQRAIIDEVIGKADLSRLGVLIGLLVGVYAQPAGYQPVFRLSPAPDLVVC